MDERLDAKIAFRTQTSATSVASPVEVDDTVADLQAHLEWSGARAESETFTLLTLDGAAGSAVIGTEFTSSRVADNGTPRPIRGRGSHAPEPVRD